MWPPWSRKLSYQYLKRIACACVLESDAPLGIRKEWSLLWLVPGSDIRECAVRWGVIPIVLSYYSYMQKPSHISLSNITKSFATKSGPVVILENLNLEIQEGERVAIVGPSGSGKSTLLSLLAGLDVPTQGTIKVAGVEMATLKEKALAQYRNETIGIIFQSFELVMPFTVSENVAAPLDISGRADSARVTELLSRVGLTERKNAYPQTLSGGEKQRVAIARALANGPSIILADEPTGSLDRTTGKAVLDLLFEEVAREQKTIVVITHDQEIAKRMDRVFELREKRLHEVV